MRKFAILLSGIALAAGGVLATAPAALAAPAARAAYPGGAGAVAFIRAGNVWMAHGDTHGDTQVRITSGGGDSWPRWSPDGEYIAYLHRGNVWISIPSAPGSEYQVTHEGDVTGAASWSPNDQYLAYWGGTELGGYLYTVRVELDASGSAVAVRAPRVLFHFTGTAKAGRRRLAAVRTTPASRAAATPWSYLRDSTSVAWSPNGRELAFHGGDCLGIYDDCLSVLVLATGNEIVLAAWGGGGIVQSGFAAVPAWSADGKLVYWTSQHDNGDSTVYPTRILSAAPGGSVVSTKARSGDAIATPSPAGGTSLLVTASHAGKAWVTLVRGNGARTYLYQGYQQDWQPIPG